VLAQLPLMLFDFEDASGSTGTLQIRIRAGTEPAAAFTAAADFISAISNLSGAVIRRISIRYSLVPAVKPHATGSTPIQQGAAFIYDCGGDARGLVYIPGVRNEYFASSGPGAGVLVNLEDSTVGAFLAAIDDAPCSNPFAADFVALLAAYRQDRP